MKPILLAAGLAAAPSFALGQNSPFLGPPDEWRLDRVSDHYATVEYYNSEARNSAIAPDTLTSDGLTVQIDLEITQGPEYLTVTPPEGWQAIPETIEVQDGTTGMVELIRAAEWQGM